MDEQRFWSAISKTRDITHRLRGSEEYLQRCTLAAARRLNMAPDIIAEMERRFGQKIDNSPEALRALAFARVCDAVTDGHQPTRSQWPMFLAAAKRMGVGEEIKVWGKENGADDE